MSKKYDVLRCNSRTRTTVMYTECSIAYSLFQNEIKSNQNNMAIRVGDEFDSY